MSVSTNVTWRPTSFVPGVSIERVENLLRQIDTAAIAPHATAAELTEVDLALAFAIAADVIRADLAIMAHTSPNPQSPEGA